MASGVTQPNLNPTNKLGAATAAAAAMSALQWILEFIWPDMPNEQLVVGLTPMVVFAAGWLIKDAPNMPTPVEEENA